MPRSGSDFFSRGWGSVLGRSCRIFWRFCRRRLRRVRPAAAIVAAAVVTSLPSHTSHIA